MPHAPAGSRFHPGFVVTLAMLVASMACDSSSPSVSPSAPSQTGGAGGQVQTVAFTGLVGAVSGACPAITFAASNRGVSTTKATTFEDGGCADVKRGALLEVQGSLAPNGGVLADRLRIATDGPGAVGLLTDVASGGYVLFFRHSERDAGAISTAALAVADNLGECVPGSELTANGRSDAIALGERFQRYGIAVEKVYASPTCRTTEMARLAFGTYETTRALTWAGMWAPGEEDALTPVLRSLLAGVPPAGRNIVLIAHNDVLRSSRVGFDITLDQAEAAVFRPHGGDSFEFLGKIPRAEWMAAR